MQKKIGNLTLFSEKLPISWQGRRDSNLFLNPLFKPKTRNFAVFTLKQQNLFVKFVSYITIKIKEKNFTSNK